IVPLMNLGKTRTLPGCSESFDHAATGVATPILNNTSNKLRGDVMFNAPDRAYWGSFGDRVCQAVGGRPLPPNRTRRERDDPRIRQCGLRQNRHDGGLSATVRTADSR